VWQPVSGFNLTLNAGALFMRSVIGVCLLLFSNFYFPVSIPQALEWGGRVADARRQTVISNGAGRLFLPHLLLRMRRPA
jgi:hypothetical protein